MDVPAQDSVELRVSLRCFVRQEGDCWLSTCPSLDVHSQGVSQDDAISSIHEAIQLWFESCIERGTLAQALQELGFRLPNAQPPEGSGGVRLDVDSSDDVLGTAVPGVTISIPAYEAAIFSSGESRATY